MPPLNDFICCLFYVEATFREFLYDGLKIEVMSNSYWKFVCIMEMLLYRGISNTLIVKVF